MMFATYRDDDNTGERLRKAVLNFERAATELSKTLEQFDLSQIPFCEKDLNRVDIGSKAKVAKFLVGVLAKQNEVAEHTQPKESSE